MASNMGSFGRVEAIRTDRRGEATDGNSVIQEGGDERRNRRHCRRATCVQVDDESMAGVTEGWSMQFQFAWKCITTGEEWIEESLFGH